MMVWCSNNIRRAARESANQVKIEPLHSSAEGTRTAFNLQGTGGRKMHHPESEAGAKSCVPSSFRVLRRHRAPHFWKKRVRGAKGDSGSGVGSPQRTTGEVKMRGGLTQRLARPFPRLSSQRSPAVGTVRRCSGLTDGRIPKGELAPAVAGVLGAEGGFGSNVWLGRTVVGTGLWNEFYTGAPRC